LQRKQRNEAKECTEGSDLLGQQTAGTVEILTQADCDKGRKVEMANQPFGLADTIGKVRVGYAETGTKKAAGRRKRR